MDNSHSETLKEKLKDIRKINQERPCKKCANYRPSSLMHCKLAAGSCDFYHNSFISTEQNSKTK